MNSRAAASADIDWTDGDQPRSRRYDDIYFSRDDGLAESRAVFLAGCGLPQAWTGRSAFVVGELGFGTGLNILALLDLWRRTRPVGARMTIFSVEAHPMTSTDAGRALGAWPELSYLATTLLEQWPRPTRGFHRIDFPDLGATLDVAVMEAGQALSGWSGRADAWFLDGFSPALNPEMWRPELLRLVAQRSAPGARLATYTVAAAVRSGLIEAGFALERKPGFGRKRERLEARLPGASSASKAAPRVAIVGGGIAGAALRRAFAALGIAAEVFADPSSAAASAAPAALVAPRLDAGLGSPAALYAQAFHRAIDLYLRIEAGVIAVGAIQLAISPDDVRRFDKIAQSDLFDPEHTRLVGDSGAIAGEQAPESLMFDNALVVDPAAILSIWLPASTPARIGAVTRVGETWRLESDTGDLVAEAEVVVLAAGVGCNDFAPSLNLGAVRGQASFIEDRAPATAVLFGGYAIPTRDGLMFGATHDRNDFDRAAREADHSRNRATLAAVLPALAASIADCSARAHVGIRATTRDFLPMAGAILPDEPGLFVLSGLGSRGFCLAPLLAEHVAAIVLGDPSPLPVDVVSIVDPARFRRREQRSRTRSNAISTQSAQQSR